MTLNESRQNNTHSQQICIKFDNCSKIYYAQFDRRRKHCWSLDISNDCDKYCSSQHTNKRGKIKTKMSSMAAIAHALTVRNFVCCNHVTWKQHRGTHLNFAFEIGSVSLSNAFSHEFQLNFCNAIRLHTTNSTMQLFNVTNHLFRQSSMKFSILLIGLHLIRFLPMHSASVKSQFSRDNFSH